ncbi:MAG: hypothetical protein MK078_04760 [Crocinitomicaceae bacterium]|nr:hypothetical protein [Crocinitomicaceae bacterium]
MEELHLRPSRKKWTKRLIIAIILLVGGFFMAYVLSQYVAQVPEWFLLVFGHILIAYAVVMILMSRQALSGKNKGLTFSKDGINDQSSIIAYGEIKWKEISEIVLEKQNNAYKILVIVKKPKSYVESASNNAIRTLREKNMDDYGTPVFFESNHFEFNLEEFEEFLTNRKIRYSKN